MTEKEYLSQVYYLDKMIDAKLEQHQRLKDFATRVSPVLVQDKVSGGSLENRTEEYICKWIDLENEINADIDRLVDIKREITEVIERVTEPKYRLLLTLRYLNCLKWVEVAERMNYGARWLRRLHNTALVLVSPHISVI